MTKSTINGASVSKKILVGQNIKRIRKLKKIKSQELADLLGYKDVSSISKLERGIYDITLDQLQTIADYMQVSIEYLLGLTESPEGMAERKLDYGITPLKVYNLPETVDVPNPSEKDFDTWTSSELTYDYFHGDGSYIVVPDGLLFWKSTDMITGHFALSADNYNYQRLFDSIGCNFRDFLIFAKTDLFEASDYVLATYPSQKYRGKFEFIFGAAEEFTYTTGVKNRVCIHDQVSGKMVSVRCKEIDMPAADDTSVRYPYYRVDNDNIHIVGRLECVIKDYRHRLNVQRGIRIQMLEGIKYDAEENRRLQKIADEHPEYFR